MAVICVDLRYNDDVGRVYLGEMTDVGWNLAGSEGELGMILRCSGVSQPRVCEDGECSIAVCGGGICWDSGSRCGGKGEQKGRVSVEMLDMNCHDGQSGSREERLDAVSAGRQVARAVYTGMPSL